MEKHNPPAYTPQDPGMFPPPPEPHFPPQQDKVPPPPPQPQVMLHTTVGFGRQPAHIRCPSCHADITTTVNTETTMSTHFMALSLCLLGCFLCAWMPYCMDSCRVKEHYCPNCNTLLGRTM